VLALACAGSAQALILQSQTYQLSGANDKDRLEVHCPGKSLPYSGGMTTDPVGIDGEGIYPHSYERLGVQHGWHVTPVFFDPSPLKSSSSRSVTLQVVCGPRLGPVSSPHTTVYVGPAQTRTAVATCPKGNRLLAGGFQRTNFITQGGNYVTESRAISDRAWQVSGGAFGTFGGELTAIAYCVRSPRALLTEVASDSTLPLLRTGSATTPACPPGTTMVAGGFTTSPAGPALISSANFNPDGSWSATAFNLFGPVASVGARGYCMATAMIKKLSKMKHGKRAPQDKIVQAPPVLDSALKVAITERINNNGCFPAPGNLVGTLRDNKINAQTAPSPRAVRRSGVVNVLTDQSSCDRVRLALKQHRSVIVLDSATGEVRKLAAKR
jgi:hypothetical protein